MGQKLLSYSFSYWYFLILSLVVCSLFLIFRRACVKVIAVRKVTAKKVSKQCKMQPVEQPQSSGFIVDASLPTGSEAWVTYVAQTDIITKANRILVAIKTKELIIQ